MTWFFTLCICGLLSLGSGARIITSYVNLNQIIFETSERYLSHTLSPKYLEEDNFDWSATKLRTLAKHLGPAYGRFGGTPANFVLFKPYDDTEQHVSSRSAEDCPSCDQVPTSNYTLTGKNLEKLHNFTTAVGWRLLFDLNDMLRNESNWDSRNAELLLRYAVKHNLSRSMDFELGNEPNAYEHVLHRKVSAKQLASDFQDLYNLLRKNPEFQSAFANSILVGPDVTQPFHDSTRELRYLKTFLENTQLKTLHAITWHHYYENYRHASGSNFTNPSTLALFPKKTKEVQKVLLESGFGAARLWMGETGSVSGKGVKGYTDGYADGFLWLDKLGQAAQLSIGVVMHSTFLDGDRCLVQRRKHHGGYRPLPAYWLSLLYTTLVGRSVFNTSVDDTSEKLRLYAHCTNNARSGYSAGSVVLIVINLHHSRVRVKLKSELNDQEIDQFLLTPKHNITSKKVNLNGQILEMVDDYTMPPILKMVKRTKEIVLPELSYGFYVLRNLRTKLCLAS